MANRVPGQDELSMGPRLRGDDSVGRGDDGVGRGVDGAGRDRERRAAIVRARRHHWARTRRTTAVLLVLWMATWVVPVFFARELSRITLFGWPLSFYLAAQGAALVFLAIVGLYAWRMRRIDEAYRRELG